MLLGREREVAALASVLESAERGQGGAVAVVGEPGAGKTTLIEHATRGRQGMRVVRFTATEAEASLGFAGLGGVLTPFRDLIDRLPGAHTAALRAALALGPSESTDRFAAYNAALGVLAAAADRQPLALVLDDAQWLDAASAHALSFVAARIGDDPIAVLAALRPDGGPALDVGRFRVLPLGGLHEADAVALLTEQGVARPVATRLARAVAGNPLALRELPALLTPEQRSGREPIPDPLPVGLSVEAAFRRQLEPLAPAPRRAILLAAAGHSPSLRVIVTALPALDADLADLAAVEELGLVAIQGDTVRLAHPLLGAVAYETATMPDRIAAHGALAAAAAGVGDLDAHAWHVARATVTADDEAAGLLDAAGQRALARTAYSAAADAFERAAALSVRGVDLTARLATAAEAAHDAGEPARALHLVERGLSHPTEPATEARLRHVRGRVLIGTGDVLPAAEALSAHARAVEADDRARAALMQVDAARALGVSGRIVDAERLAERAAANAVAAGRPELRAVAEAIRCLALLLLGERALADTLLPRVRALADAPHPLLAAMLHRSLLFADEFVEAEHVLERAIHRYRASGGVAALPELLGFQADLAYRLGRWDEAAMLAEEGIRLAPEFDQPMGGSGQALLARIAAARGREQEAREHIATARAVARATGAHAVRSYSDATLGLLELSLGHAEAAIEALGAAWRATESIGGLIATEVQEAPDLVEAYVAAGREREAERVLVTFEQRGIRARSRWTLAAAARCRGLLAGQGFGEHFERALALHAALPTPFEEARTELAYGERLSRAGRHDEAHDLLTRATARFELLDAAPWAARAKAPLTGGGGRERPRSQAGALTAQELRVALLVARGATNREAAHELFVTPKTIEKHLAACYQKLGVRNRTELAATMLRPPASSRARVGLEESGSPDVPPLHGEV